MNVSMPIAAVLLDLDFPPAILKGIPILARTAVAARPSRRGERAPDRLPDGRARRGGDRLRARRRRLMRDPPAETLPWDAQAAADDARLPRAGRLPLRPLAVLPRASSPRPASPTPRSVGGLAGIAALPFTEKDELRASRTPENPIGAHLAAPMAEIVRIYSTSGTTGAPSYIPLTRADLADWIAISCRSYAASGVARRAAARLHLRRRAVRRRGRRSTPSHALGLCHIPVGPGNTERLMAAVAAAEARRGRADPVLRAAPRRAGGGARHRPRRAPASRGCWSPASPAAASRSCAPGSRRPGARGSPRRWASATSRSRSGASARRRPACTSPAAASSMSS